MRLDAQASASGHNRNRIGAAIECRRLLGVARKFRDSAECADAPCRFDIGQMLEEKIQKSRRARHSIPPPLVAGAGFGGAAVVAATPDDAKLDGTPPTCTVMPP